MLGNKKLLISSLIAFACCLVMVMFPQEAISSARRGVFLWTTDVFPALLPFFICANYLQEAGMLKYLRPGTFTLTMSILSGYPMGAKIIGDMRRKKEITLEKSMWLMSFCNTSGPAFMMGSVGAGMLGSVKAGFILAFSHYIGALLNAIVYRKLLNCQNSFRETPKMSELKIVEETATIQETLTNAILASLKSVAIVLSYIVLAMFATDMLEMSGLLSFIDSGEARAFINGMVEMTVGCESLAACEGVSIEVKSVLCSMMISWGGLSVIGQIMSMVAGTDIPLLYTLICKFTHGLFSAGVAFVITAFMV